MGFFDWLTQDQGTYYYYKNTLASINNKPGYSPEEFTAMLQAIDMYYHGITRPLTLDEENQKTELIAAVSDRITEDPAVYNLPSKPSTAILPAGNILPGTMAWESFNPISDIQKFMEDNKGIIIGASVIGVIGIGFYLYSRSKHGKH